MSEPVVKFDSAGLSTSATKLPIVAPFDKEEVGFENAIRQIPRRRSRYRIDPHPGFEVVELPYQGKDGKPETGKIAYNCIYPETSSDLTIELNQIARWEGRIRQRKGEEKIQALNSLKFHYKRAISLISPKLSGGWNRWADNILDLMLSNKRNKVLWGSGGCSKSTIVGLCYYTWWRVNPIGRLVIIASRVKKEADRRVIAYIKEIHLEAPPDDKWKLHLIDKSDETGIYCMQANMIGKKINWVKMERAGIIALPIKIEGATRELGSNLLGNHPDEALRIIFDEAQELPGDLMDMKIFSNWLTNPNVSVTASGNPKEVELYTPKTWDLLFRLGVGEADVSVLKRREREAEKTGIWHTKNTVTLHLSMLDSPKDDATELDDVVTDQHGVRMHRLSFLAGKINAEAIEETTSKGSPAWYSQVLGFPFLITDTQSDLCVLTPSAVAVSREYPLRWINREQNRFIIGVDPSLGRAHDLAIVAIELGLMRDGRWGIDVHDGKYCRRMKKVDVDSDTTVFVDNAIELLYQISQQLNVALDHIEIELHGVGEVFRYAMQRHIENGKWAVDFARGLRYAICNPTRGVSDRQLFRSPGKMEPAKEIVSDFPTELWMAVRCGIINRQVFNVPDFILEQGYRRNFVKNSSGTKYRLETKDEMLKRGVKSPNDFDAFASAFDRARDKGFKFVFANRHAYKDKFGNDYMTEVERIHVNKHLGVVSQALGLGVDLGEVNGGIDRKLTGNDNRRKLFSFKSV